MKYRIVLVASLLCGCSELEGAGPFPFVGKFDDYKETFTGEIRFDYMRQLAYITAQTRESRLRCEGLSRITYKPPYSLVDCIDFQSIVRLECGGGRILTGDSRAKTCNSGDGTGTDSSGAKFSFSYGMNQAEAQQYLASAAAELASKPSLGQGSSGGSGTGFLISADGLIVTNHHVINGARGLEVHRGGMVYPASLVAQDPANDLAILRADVRGRPLNLASARTSMRGDEVLTLGYPLTSVEGESQKATFGRINATAGIRDDIRYLQIDIPIQPGNSGGPLLNKRGEVIGVVSQTLNSASIFDQFGAIPQNVNYAVKADYISALLPQSAQLPAAGMTQEVEFTALVGMVENSVVRVISKP